MPGSSRRGPVSCSRLGRLPLPLQCVRALRTWARRDSRGSDRGSLSCRTSSQPRRLKPFYNVCARLRRMSTFSPPVRGSTARASSISFGNPSCTTMGRSRWLSSSQRGRYPAEADQVKAQEVVRQPEGEPQEVAKRQVMVSARHRSSSLDRASAGLNELSGGERHLVSRPPRRAFCLQGAARDIRRLMMPHAG